MIQLLINADDFGLSDGVNQAIKKCFDMKYINRTTLMVNMPSSDSAAFTAKNSGFFSSVGLHLNLIEGYPLTNEIKKTVFCNGNGVFNGTALRLMQNRFYFDKKTRNAVSIEIRAQIEKYLQYGFQLKHIDSHEHAHTNFSVINLIFPLLQEYDFKSIRLLRNLPTADISGLKMVYKNTLNRRLLRFNKKNINNDNILFDKFGSQLDIENELMLIGNNNLSAEMMVHPIMINGCLKDAINQENIQSWLKRNERKIDR